MRLTDCRRRRPSSTFSVTALEAKASPFMPPLTQREEQVLQQVVQEASSKEIARTLNLSPRTVGIYRSNLLHKLGARNAADLTRKALTELPPVAVID
jgi:DNA-binding CsgD family transcriptional regulator